MLFSPRDYAKIFGFWLGVIAFMFGSFILGFVLGALIF